MADTNRYRNHLLKAKLNRSFDKSEVNQFMIGSDSLTLQDIENTYGVDLIKAFNNEPSRSGRRLKWSIFLLNENLSSITMPKYYTQNSTTGWDYGAKFKLYSNGVFVKTLVASETYTFPSNQNTKNYLVTYLYATTIDNSFNSYAVPVNCICGFSGYFRALGFSDLGLKQWFFVGDRNSWGSNFPTCAYGTGLLGEVYVQDGVISMPERCFQSQSRIKGIRLPRTWQKPELNPVNPALTFYDCTSIEKVVYQGTLQEWKDKKIFQTVGNYANSDSPFYRAKATCEFYVDDGATKPTHVDYYSGEEVKACAFANIKQLTSISFDDSIQYIGNYAFSGCSNLVWNITNYFRNLTYLGAGAFSDCIGVTGQLTIPSTLSSIGINAFRNSRISGHLTIPGTLTQIGDEAFYMCYGLTSIWFEYGIQKLGSMVFYRCSGVNQDEIIIPESVTAIDGVFLLYTCSIKRVIFNQQVSSINIGICFYNRNSKYFDFGKYITQLCPPSDQYGLPLKQNGAIVLRGDSIPTYYELIPNTSTATLFCKIENLETFQSTWNTFSNYVGFTIVDNLPLSASEGEYYYQNLDNHIYKYENSAWTDITATYV